MQILSQSKKHRQGRNCSKVSWNSEHALQAFENKISELEEKRRKKADRDDRNMLKKKNILQRIEDIEKRNDEKDKQIKLLSSWDQVKTEKLQHEKESEEEKSQETDI